VAIGARSKLKIKAIQTGTGNPPVRLIASPQNIGTLRRRLGVLLCRKRTGPHPINAYLIEHPEGLIVVDTGDTARKSDRDYLPRLIRHSTDIRVAPEEEIGPQRNAMGIRCRDVRLVVMTHMHLDQNPGLRYSSFMKWEVSLKDSVRDDLGAFGKKDGRLILQAALQLLTEDPLAETKKMMTLRPNAFAQRELRLLGKYRVLFNVDRDNGAVTVLAVGEKRGIILLVQGEEFRAHESDIAE
jgi:mRNA-degrading endonuclease RelE of RelBE toxin-antitoxin system